MISSYEPAAYARWFETEPGRQVWKDERRALERVIGPVSGLRILDAGAGDGRLALELANGSAITVGVDRSAAMLHAARDRAGAVVRDFETITTATNPAAGTPRGRASDGPGRRNGVPSWSRSTRRATR